MAFEICFIALLIYPKETVSTGPGTSTDFDHLSEALKDESLSDDQQCVDFGNECVKLQKYELALRFFDKAILLQSHKALLYRLRGECHLNLKNWDDAIIDYRQSITLEPNEPVGQEGLRRAVAFKQCLGIDLNDVLSSDRSAEEFFKLGEKCLEVKALKEASMYYSAAIGKDPHNKYYIKRAQCHYKMQNYGLAELDMRHLLEKQPHNKTARLTLHQILIDSHQYDAALQDMMQNDSGIVQFGTLGDQLLGTAKKFVDAFQCYTKALEKCPPGDAYLLAQRRQACYRAINKQSFDEAVVDFQKLLILEPHNIQIRKILVETLLRAGRFEEAMKESKALDSTEILAVAVEFMKKEEFRGALICFTEFIERNQKNPNPSSFLWRGLCYRSLGIKESAIADYRRAVELRPQDWQALTELSEMLVEAEELEEAEKIAKFVSENTFKYEIYADIHDRIQKVQQIITEKWIERPRGVINMSVKHSQSMAANAPPSLS